MAKIGLKYFVVAPVKTDTTNGITYENGKNIAAAIKADIKITATDDKLYADDVLAENVKSFVSGDLALELDELATEDYAKYFGHEIDTETKELVAKEGELPIAVGCGFYGTVIKNGIKSYRAIWLTHHTFKEPDETFSTKADKITFGTRPISGTFKTAKNGEWKREKTFEKETDAIAWLNEKAGITEAAPAANEK